MSCFSCRQNLMRYKQEFETKGIVRYYYRLQTNGDIYICRPASFNTILETQIKPNFVNGAEYGHISEYNG